MNKAEQQARREEISNMLMKMGKSLLDESSKTGDNNVSQIGTTMIFLSGLVLKSKDMFLFSQICSMFSAKQMVDNMMDSPLGSMMRGAIMDKADEIDGMEGLSDILKKLKGKQNGEESDSDNTPEE